MSQSRDYLIVFIAAMVLAMVGSLFALRYYRQQRFESVQERLDAQGSRLQLRGRYGDASLDAYGDVSPEELGLVETCGPIARLGFVPSEPGSPDLTGRMLTLPGIQDIFICTSFPLSDDLIAGMCRTGAEIRAINFVAQAAGDRTLAQFAGLPALERLQISGCEATGGNISLTTGFARLKILILESNPLDVFTARFEVARLPNLELLELVGNRSLRDASAAEVVIADLPNLDTATAVVGQSYNESRLKVSGCPKLRRLAISLGNCDSRVLNEIADSSPELRELAIETKSTWGPSEAAALARLEHLESLDLRQLRLSRSQLPSLLGAIARLPHLARLRIYDWHFLHEGDEPSEPIENGAVDRAQESVWKPLAGCGRLEELAFWINLEVPGDLSWIADLKSLRKLDLAECKLGIAAFNRWQTPSADEHSTDELGTPWNQGPLVEHALATCLPMPSLVELVLDAEQLKMLVPDRELGKLQIQKSRSEEKVFGWGRDSETDPGMK